jgi:DNA end-binding protein Ku
MVEPEELKEFAPRATRTIDIEDFVSLDEIDPIFYDATYYLAPEKSDGAKKAYVLLREAMEDQKKVAIGRLVMRTKQYLAAIRPYEKGMSLSTMLFHDEIVPVSDIDEIPTARVKAAPAEVKMAGQIIDSMSREWDPKRYEDTYRIQVLDFLKKKAAGEEIVVEEEPEEQADVSDLMAALEASLAAAKKGGSSSRSSSSARKAPARKTAAKKAPAKKSSSTSRRSSSGSSSGGSKRKSA